MKFSKCSAFGQWSSPTSYTTSTIPELGPWGTCRLISCPAFRAFAIHSLSLFSHYSAAMSAVFIQWIPWVSWRVAPPHAARYILGPHQCLEAAVRFFEPCFGQRFCKIQGPQLFFPYQLQVTLTPLPVNASKFLATDKTIVLRV